MDLFCLLSENRKQKEDLGCPGAPNKGGKVNSVGAQE